MLLVFVKLARLLHLYVHKPKGIQQNIQDMEVFT